jgi:DegV family protein with EDD domain
MTDLVMEDHCLTAAALATAMKSGIHRVIREQEYLNRINVFPVADGDTGTNLSLSLGASLGRLSAAPNQRMESMLEAVADALLDGARGNSGAIMAQFFQGVSDSAVNLAAFDTRSFTISVRKGSDYAHDAISDPQPGTILSVIAAFANGLADQVRSNDEVAFPALLKTGLSVAQSALARTTNELEVLRKAGVVDAGAKGFVVLLEGMFDFLVLGKATSKPDAADLLPEAIQMETAGADVDLEFRYCTECMVNGEAINRRKLREELSAIGGSLVLAGTKKKAKIHVHVSEPEQVFDIARRFGAVSGEKADDMQLQQHSSHDRVAKFAVITDSSADIADVSLEDLDIHTVPLRLQFGERGYLDKVSISAAEFFSELQENPAAPTTSQPSPGDFRRQYQFLASHFDDVISISLAGNVSGTLQAAETAAGRVSARGHIHVLDTRNASAGQGLLAVTAAECAHAGLDVSLTLKTLRRLVPHTHSFALLTNLQCAVRGGRVPAYVERVAKLLHVSPVFRTTPDGKISAAGVLLGRRNSLPAFARFIANRVDSGLKLRVSIAHAICEDEAVQLKSLLLKRLPSVHSCEITELGAAIGVHGGPGCIVVGVQPYLSPDDIRDQAIPF